MTDSLKNSLCIIGSRTAGENRGLADVAGSSPKKLGGGWA